VNRFRTPVTHGGRRAPVRLAWLVAAGLLAAGCAPPPPSPAQATLTNAEIAVLTNSGLAGQAAAQVNNAYEGLVKQCMEAKGLVYYPLIQAVNSISPHPPLAGIPQAYVGLAAREANGYGFYSPAAQPAGTGQSGGTDPEDRYIAALPAVVQQRYVQALQGPDTLRVTVTYPGGTGSSITAGGCRGAAERRVYGSVANYLQATTGASLQGIHLSHTVTADPTFLAVVARWSSCMTKHGYHYRSPADLWNSLSAHTASNPTPAARDLEIRVSVADYNCSAATKLVPTVQALQDEHIRHLDKPFAANLALITRIEGSALKEARTILAATLSAQAVSAWWCPAAVITTDCHGARDWHCDKRLAQGPGHRADSPCAMRSAITIVVRLVFAAGMAGITDASATQSRSIPWTAPRALTTAPSPGRGPIAQVPTGWW
jgi:hypothetical protein